MKTIVFIDGENFIHQVRDMLYKRRLIRNREELATYDIRALMTQSLAGLHEFDPKNVKVYYYAAKIHLSDQSDTLKERTESIKIWNERLREQLSAHRVDFVEAGHLLVREGKRCVECGHREPVLMEKGVDVQLAVDLIRSSGDNVRLVLLSSDGDLMPAVTEAKRRGSEVVYLGFRGVSNLALARLANQRFTINSKQVESVFRQGSKDKEPEVKPVEQDQHQHKHASPRQSRSDNGRT